MFPALVLIFLVKVLKSRALSHKTYIFGISVKIGEEIFWGVFLQGTHAEGVP